MAGIIESLMNVYRQAITAPQRTYGESLIKSAMGRTDSPITRDDFTPRELAELDTVVRRVYAQKSAEFAQPRDALLAKAAELEAQAKDADLARAQTEAMRPGWGAGMPRSSDSYRNRAKQYLAVANGAPVPNDFSVDYHDYVGPENEPDTGMRNVLGRFRFKVDAAKGTYQAYDSYDFNNESRQTAVKEYAAMPPLQRLTTAAIDEYKGHRGALGEAYLGTKGVPVSIDGTLK
jgi:hypothetical protein